jgi:hypothetical protein
VAVGIGKEYIGCRPISWRCISIEHDPCINWAASLVDRCALFVIPSISAILPGTIIPAGRDRIEISFADPSDDRHWIRGTITGFQTFGISLRAIDALNLSFRQVAEAVGTSSYSW